MTELQRVLVVSYAFPPVGGAGVQRSVKLLKYLGDFGWVGDVLTVDNPSVPLRDDSLLCDVPPTAHVYRARTLEPSYATKEATWGEVTSPQATASPWRSLRGRALSVARRAAVPDPQVLWLPGAVLALRRVLRGPLRPAAVLLSAPPFSQFLLGPVVRQHPGVGLVYDYRDEWSTARTTYEMLQGGIANAVGSALERRLLPLAHVITTATEEFAEHLVQRFPALPPERLRVITNGFDPDDFPEHLPPPNPQRWVLSYAGTVFKLTSAQGLLGAVRRLLRDSPQLANDFEVRFLGRIVDTERSHFAELEGRGVQCLGYVPHGELFSRLSESHELLCLLDDVPGAERIYPAKIFELMNLRRPILTLAPEGALTRLVRRHELGAILPPRDEVAIARYLAQRIDAFRAGKPSATAAPDPARLGQYHRRAIAEHFVEALRLAVDRARLNHEG